MLVDETLNLAGARAMSLETDRLSAAEDSELRQLTWFARAGQLSDASQSRLAQLKARDRRDQVRDARPDPVTRDSDYVGTRLDSQPIPTVPCQNCGFRIPEATPPASSCRNCGVCVPRHYDEPAPTWA